MYVLPTGNRMYVLSTGNRMYELSTCKYCLQGLGCTYYSQLSLVGLCSWRGYSAVGCHSLIMLPFCTLLMLSYCTSLLSTSHCHSAPTDPHQSLTFTRHCTSQVTDLHHPLSFTNRNVLSYILLSSYFCLCHEKL